MPPRSRKPTYTPTPREFAIKEDALLLDWLVETPCEGNRTKAKVLLTGGSVSVNGLPAKRHDVSLKPGDRVSIVSAAGRNSTRPLPFPILWEDEHYLAIAKPHGLLTIGSEGEKERTAHRHLNDHFRARNNRIFVVHRLDRETSGVVLFAKSDDAKKRLQAAWDSTEKIYVAVVEGTPPTEEATLVNWLFEDAGLRVTVGPEHPPGQRAVTHYRVMEARNGKALLAVNIETGRKHQIRVQLSAVGLPIVGDNRYGSGRKAPRLLLHAESIAFIHPFTKKKVRVECEPGKGFSV